MEIALSGARTKLRPHHDGLVAWILSAQQHRSLATGGKRMDSMMHDQAERYTWSLRKKLDYVPFDIQQVNTKPKITSHMQPHTRQQHSAQRPCLEDGVFMAR